MKERNKAIDVLKGIAIILVTMGHTDPSPIGNSIIYYIYTFHMPLFFAVTGYLSYTTIDKGFLNYLLKKIKTILVPYVIFFIISILYGNLIVRYVFHQYVIPFNLTDTLQSLIYSGNWLNYIPTFNAPLWFLPVLFASVMVYYFLRKIKNIWIFTLITVLLIAITIPFQQNIFPGFQPWNIGVLSAAIGFIGLGHIYKHFEDNIKLNKAFLLVIIPMFAFTIWYTSTLSVKEEILNIRDYFYFFAAAFSIFIYYHFAKDISNSNVLAFLGRNTLIIFGLHALVNNTYQYTYLHSYFTKHFSGLLLFSLNILYMITVTSMIVIIWVYFSKVIKELWKNRLKTME